MNPQNSSGSSNCKSRLEILQQFENEINVTRRTAFEKLIRKYESIQESSTSTIINIRTMTVERGGKIKPKAFGKLTTYRGMSRRAKGLFKELQENLLDSSGRDDLLDKREHFMNKFADESSNISVVRACININETLVVETSYARGCDLDGSMKEPIDSNDLKDSSYLMNDTTISFDKSPKNSPCRAIGTATLAENNDQECPSICDLSYIARRYESKGKSRITPIRVTNQREPSKTLDISKPKLMDSNNDNESLTVVEFEPKKATYQSENNLNYPSSTIFKPGNVGEDVCILSQLSGHKYESSFWKKMSSLSINESIYLKSPQRRLINRKCKESGLNKKGKSSFSAITLSNGSMSSASSVNDFNREISFLHPQCGTGKVNAAMSDVCSAALNSNINRLHLKRNVSMELKIVCTPLSSAIIDKFKAVAKNADNKAVESSSLINSQFGSTVVSNSTSLHESDFKSPGICHSFTKMSLRHKLGNSPKTISSKVDNQIDVLMKPSPLKLKHLVKYPSKSGSVSKAIKYDNFASENFSDNDSTKKVSKSAAILPGHSGFPSQPRNRNYQQKRKADEKVYSTTKKYFICESTIQAISSNSCVAQQNDNVLPLQEKYNELSPSVHGHSPKMTPMRKILKAKLSHMKSVPDSTHLDATPIRKILGSKSNHTRKSFESIIVSSTDASDNDDSLNLPDGLKNCPTDVSTTIGNRHLFESSACVTNRPKSSRKKYSSEKSANDKTSSSDDQKIAHSVHRSGFDRTDNILISKCVENRETCNYQSPKGNNSRKKLNFQSPKIFEGTFPTLSPKF